MPWIQDRLVSTAQWLRYLYLMRFSLLLWLFTPLLCFLNVKGGRTITSGIVTPETSGQYTCVGFFLFTASFVALIIARVVAANGEERFGAPLPAGLKALLVNDQGKLEWEAVIVSLLPAVGTYVYFWGNSQLEGVGAGAIGGGLLLGSALAVLVWLAINAAFYLTYAMPRGAAGNVTLGVNAARTILFPRALFFLVPPGQPIDTTTLEGATTRLAQDGINKKLVAITNWFAAWPGTMGYLVPGRGFYEGHFFSAIAIAGFFCLYLALWPVTAPVPLVTQSIAFISIFIGIPSLVGALIFWTATPGAKTKLWKWRRTQVGFTAALAAFLAAVYWLYLTRDAARFPVLALILILVILLAWSLSAIAFFADRYRVPVLLLVLLLVVIPRSLVDGREEHYLSTVDPPTPERTVLTPEQILEMKSSLPGNFPLIVVTATGGGLHASAWTATVLSQLELEFAKTSDGHSGESFHKHILLASTVSGGSVGLLSYLAEIESRGEGHAFDSVAEDQVENSAQCSSLEAVGWGLAYYDLPKAIFPYWVPESTGIDDLDHSPMIKDRTWSLRKGFARNLHDESCNTAGQRNKLQAEAAIKADEGKLTLAKLLVSKDDPTTPAFTMNTTAVEGGSRFLLSNYGYPGGQQLGGFEANPAQSFLGLYDCPGQQGKLLDLPLATAAQLSGTFPFVSSATRVPVRRLTNADGKEGADLGGLHFVDGGYYDNDGTASAIEFLRSALNHSGQKPCERTSNAPAATSSADASGAVAPIRVLLVEIRNSGNPGKDEQATSTDAANLFWQLRAVFEAFWNSGHESTTPRNRVGLDQLVKSYPNLEIKQVVFDDDNSTGTAKTDPLNWSLTPAQRNEVKNSATCNNFGQKYAEVKQWFYKSADEWSGLKSK